MRSDIIVSGLSNLLPATTGSAAAAAANAAVPALSNLIVTQAPSVAQAIQVTKPQMQTLYRGISAKTDDDLAQYIRDMVNKNIQPATYGGGNMQGEGYNFSTGKDTAEYFATRNPIKESRAILKTEVPMDRFIQQNEQNQNRLQDFVRRAEARGIPYENGESERQGIADMQRYFKKNGILGVKSHSGETYVINNNDDAWMKNLEVSDAMKGRRTRIEPDSNLLASLSDTMDIYNSAKRDLSPEVTKYLPDKATARYYLDDQNMGSVDLSGKPVVGQKVDLTNLPDSQYPVRRSQIPSGVDQTTGIGHVDLAKSGTETQQFLPKVQEDSLTEIAKRLNAMKQSRSIAEDVKRIGSAAVAEVNPETLPGGWKELEKYLDTAQDRLPNAIGKPRSKITKADIAKYLEDVGYDTEGTKDELWKSALMAIDDAAVDELYEAGGAAGEFLQDRLPFRQNPRLTDATNYYIGAKGRTGRLDAEYSDRLGIGRSNTPMSDRLVNPYGGAAGDYARGAFGTDPTWATGESGVSTAAHERLHAMQNIDKFDWDEEVVDAIDELRAELKNFYHDEKQIKAYHGNGKTDYYISGDEQEARMLQSYLDNEGYTNTYRKNSEKGTEWGDEIKPAFDKFFKKLRALSKKGIALPSLALLFGGAAVASKEKEKK